MNVELQSIRSQLDRILEVEFTFLNTQPLAEKLARLDHKQLDFVFDWIKRLASAHVQLAYQFACQAEQALQEMGEELTVAWCVQSMDDYDAQGLYPAMQRIKDLAGFKQWGYLHAYAAWLENAQPVLKGFILGLSGRALRIDKDQNSWTDGETLYLPRLLAVYQDKNKNFQLYKAISTQLWAQTRFGTLNLDPNALLSPYPDQKKALRWFHYLESLRFDQIIAQELPGLYRQIEQYAPKRLDLRLDSVEDSQRALAQYYDHPCPELPMHAGGMDLLAAWSARQARLEREKAQFRIQLKLLSDALHLDAERPFKIRSSSQWQDPLALPRLELMHGDQILPVPEDMQSLMHSIQIDCTEIPEDYLVPAGEGDYSEQLEPSLDPEKVWSGTYHEEGAYFYDEWDQARQTYRKKWCVLREIEGQLGDHAFYTDTLQKYRGLLKSLRRSFEALKGDNQALKRQIDGEELDLDAMVEAWSAYCAGQEMNERLFIRTRQDARNIAALFMVDMSGSTKGWINQAEREALVLLVESLQVLGDQYAIYGFSGWARKRCEIYRIKSFDEPLNESVKQRIAGIEAKDYTRMGAAIRHLNTKLVELNVRTKLLITLSDGKPDDYDHYYRGIYGIEDTRQALFETRLAGIHPFCITIDKKGADYLPHLYGRANYIVLDEVAQLPLKIADIYRKLTV